MENLEGNDRRRKHINYIPKGILCKDCAYAFSIDLKHSTYYCSKFIASNRNQIVTSNHTCEFGTLEKPEISQN